jgi:hypothetical protein
MGGVRMFRLGMMHRTGARSSASETSSHMQYWAGYITGTHESSFWKRQQDQHDNEYESEATAAVIPSPVKGTATEPAKTAE